MPICSQGVISSARRSAKAEVRGANPRESATFNALVPQQPQGGFRKPVFVGASPTMGPTKMQNSECRVKSEEFAVRPAAQWILHSALRTLHFLWWSWCNSSIAPRDGAGIGANPFGHPKFRHSEFCTLNSELCTALDGPKLIDYPPPIRRAYRSWRKPWRSGFDSRHWSASVRSRHLSI